MTRQRLPNRRFRLGQELPFWSSAASCPVAVDIGFDGEGAARELFVDGLKTGSDLRALVTHASILASLLLQCGHDAAELVARLGAPELADPDSDAAGHSVISRALAVAVQLEAVEGASIRDAHMALGRCRSRGGGG